MPERAAEGFSKRKTLTKVHKVRKKLKTGDYPKVSTTALGLHASWGRLASNRVPHPTGDCGSSEHHRVLLCGDQGVSVCRIMSPQWRGFTLKVEMVGSRHAALLGVPSSSADATFIRSATMACHDIKFHLCTNAVVLGKMGLLAAPIPMDLVEPECVLPLWVVLHSLKWGRQHHVLVKSGKVVAQHHKEIVDDTIAWWQDVCRVTEWNPSSRGWQTERVLCRCIPHACVMMLQVWLNWTPPQWSLQYYEVQAWSSIPLPESATPVTLTWSCLSANDQGLNRSVEIRRNKWDEVVEMCVTSDARVLFIQETWGSVKKLDKRCIEGFWHRSSAHCDVGKGLEVWVQASWAQFKTILLDTDSSFLVVIHNAWGLGVLGSVHMAKRTDDLLYNRQLVHLVHSLQQLPVSWLIVGGDWNRDIRTHQLSAARIKFLGARVAFMQGRVQLPKDFCIMKGVSGQSYGMWLKEVGDHPVCWIQGCQTARAGATGSVMRPVEAV